MNFLQTMKYASTMSMEMTKDKYRYKKGLTSMTRPIVLEDPIGALLRTRIRGALGGWESDEPGDFLDSVTYRTTLHGPILYIG